ncbi:MAG: hypothetical protein VZR33_01550 [Methanosphaera sp.]|nr:hypothetical protein [Methanosphaera sp.]
MENFSNYLIENSKTYKSDLSWIDNNYNDVAMQILSDLLTPRIKEEIENEIDKEIAQYLMSNNSWNISDDEYTWEIMQKSDAIANSKPYDYEKWNR